MQQKATWRRVWIYWVSGLAVVAAVAGVGQAAAPQEGNPEAAEITPVQAAVVAGEPAAGGPALQPESCTPSDALGTSSSEPALIPRPGLPGDSNCPNFRCSVDFDCATECYVPNCPPPCGACVYETSEECSGYCFCR